MYDARLTNRPAWYELSFKDGGTLVIRVHERAMDRLRSLGHRLSHAQVFERKFGLGPFAPLTGDVGGFQGTLKLVSDSDHEWSTLECAFPIEGHEGGQAITPSLRRLYAVRSSLSYLFAALERIPDGDLDSGPPQLLVINGVTVEEKQHGGHLYVTLTPPVTKWLERHADEERIIAIEEAMRATYCHIAPTLGEVFGIKEFRAVSRKSRGLFMVVPGNACGLGVLPNESREVGEGYCLTPHNIDSGLEQLTLLMGLAKLHDLVRAA